VKDKIGKQNLRIVIGHKIFNFLFLILYAIIIINIAIKYINIIRTPITKKYKSTFFSKNGVKWKCLKVENTISDILSWFHIGQNYIFEFDNTHYYY
jgi:hypothetical protein